MRKNAKESREVVRLSIPVPVDVWARLCGLAALRQVDRSTLAAEFVRRGVRGVLLKDGTQSSEPDSPAA